MTVQWFATFLADLLVRLIPWLFSGKTTQHTGHTDGLDGLDQGGVTGTGDLTPENLPDL
jgi:hypothetical protein